MTENLGGIYRSALRRIVAHPSHVPIPVREIASDALRQGDEIMSEHPSNGISAEEETPLITIAEAIVGGELEPLIDDEEGVRRYDFSDWLEGPFILTLGEQRFERFGSPGEETWGLLLYPDTPEETMLPLIGLPQDLALKVIDNALNCLMAAAIELEK